MDSRLALLAMISRRIPVIQIILAVVIYLVLNVVVEPLGGDPDPKDDSIA